jgi:hypothetical protein
MPKDEFCKYKTQKEETKFYNLSYNDHKQTFEDSELKGYEKMSNKLIELQKDNKNALIVCNNGYQRSLPFLCYYLVKYHGDEFNIDSAIEMILSQVDKKNCMDLKDKYIKTIQKLNLISKELK